MIKTGFAIFLFIYLSVLYTLAQIPNSGKPAYDIFKIISEPSANHGKIIIQQDEQLKTLVERYIEYRRKETTIPGYRIRIFSDSGNSARQKALSERNRFVKEFPDIATYLEYEAPNFKVYVGDFRTKIEGFITYKHIGKDFHNAFLVPARINPANP